MRRKVKDPEAYRDWPGHSPALIAVIDNLARSISPAWSPDKQRRRWVWRYAFYLHHEWGATITGYRDDNTPFSPTQSLERGDYPNPKSGIPPFDVHTRAVASDS
jgi:hypothetical protein